MTFRNFITAIDFRNAAAGFKARWISAEPHRAAKIGIFIADFDFARFGLPFRNQRDDRVRRFAIELGAHRTLEPRQVARRLDDRNLHAETDAEVRYAVLARKAHGLDLAFDATIAKTAGHDYAVHVTQAVDTLLFNVR